MAGSLKTSSTVVQPGRTEAGKIQTIAHSGKDGTIGKAGTGKYDLPPLEKLPQENNRQMIRARNNIIKTLLVSVSIMAVLMSYKEAYVFLGNAGFIPYNIASVSFQTASGIGYMVCCSDPIIYFCTYEEFQKGVKKLFTCGRYTGSRKVGGDMEESNMATRMNISVEWSCSVHDDDNTTIILESKMGSIIYRCLVRERV